MNLKKILAGVAAGALVVSSMALTAFAADEAEPIDFGWVEADGKDENGNNKWMEDAFVSNSDLGDDASAVVGVDELVFNATATDLLYGWANGQFYTNSNGAEWQNKSFGGTEYAKQAEPDVLLEETGDFSVTVPVGITESTWFVAGWATSADKGTFALYSIEFYKEKVLVGTWTSEGFELAPEEDDTTPEEDEPVELDDLTIEGFFGARTDSVELKDGGTLTICFNNKSNGTDNWENFILAVVGDNYENADQEALIIRADNWGWGGGLSDFMAPDAADGNKLAFETNIATADANNWAAWAAMMQAGCDVEITLCKDGDTLSYEATFGDYYVRLNATSGKALPENLYVFLTGQNVTLSNIQVVVDNPEAPAITEPEETTKPEETTDPAGSTTTAPEAQTPAFEDEDEDSGVSVSAAAGVVQEGAKLVVEAKEVKEGDTKAVYEISLVVGEGENQKDAEVKGEVTVSIPVPEEFKDAEKIYVYYQNDKGEIVEDLTAKSEVKDGVITFKTTHFSTYVLSTEEIPLANTGNAPATGVALAAIPVIIAATGVIVSKKRK